MTTQNTQNTNVIVTPEIQALIDNAVATAVSQTAAAIINSMKKPAAKKGNTRSVVQVGGEELLAKMTEIGLEASDVLLHQSARTGRWTLFTQFAKTEKEALEVMGTAGFVAWSDANSYKDYWQNHRVIRMYADIPEGCEENYKMFPLTSSVVKSKKK